MASKQVIFSDRLVNISLQGGMVRIDLAVMAGTAKGKDDQPAVRLEATHQIVMPLEGFVAGVRMQEKLVKELIAREQQQRAAAVGGGEAVTTPEAPAAA